MAGGCSEAAWTTFELAYLTLLLPKITLNSCRALGDRQGDGVCNQRTAR
jgi:hypothetical protein